jgi:hypothetical protein
MLTNTKIALSAALLLAATSATLANDGISAAKFSEHLGHGQKKALALTSYGRLRPVPGSTIRLEWGTLARPIPNASSCPSLEGYPDCHPE